MISLSPARAEASRRNGARSQGPKTPEGKARSARNALKHGLCAQDFVVLHDEDEQAYQDLEAGMLAELAPQGALQRFLAARVVRAAWRVERAERIEIELLEYRMGLDGDLALALVRDGNGTQSIDTLMRYRGRALAEFYRALRTLKALQEEAAAPAVGTSSPPARDEPESRTNPGVSAMPSADDADLPPPPQPEETDTGEAPLAPPTTSPDPQSAVRPNQPETRANPGGPHRDRVDRPGRRAA